MAIAAREGRRARVGIGNGLTLLGIDPGLADCGWGVVRWDARAKRAEHVSHGVLSTPAHETLAERVDTLSRGVLALINEHEPFEIAAEAWVWYGRSAGAGVHVIRVCGAIRALAITKGLACAEYQARAVKLAVTGSANGEKSAVQAAVKAHLGLAKTPRPDHAADALAVALTHLAALRGVPVSMITKGNDKSAAPARKAG